MDNVFIQRMRENRRWYVEMCAFFGLLFTVCLYRNLSGITFPLITAALLGFSVIFLKKNEIPLQKGSRPYFAGIMLLGISTVLTDRGFFHFFNIVGIVLLFMMVMAHQLYSDDEWGFTDYVKKFFIMSGSWIGSLAEPFYSMKKNGESPAECTENGEDNADPAGRFRSRQAGAVLCGVAAAIVLLMIVLPLLFSSDRIFSHVFNRIFGFFNPLKLLENIDIGNIIGIGLTFVFGMFSLYAFFAGLFKMKLTGKDEEHPGRISPVTGIAFAGIVAAVYVLYAGIQILFLFLGMDQGLPDGVTYSQYAHEGFWQLLLVSLINFVTVLICVQIFVDNRMLKILLSVISVCTCIMILSAGYRMMLYVKEYDLSFLRVLVLWFLLVLLIWFVGIIQSIFRRHFRLFRYMTAVVSVCYILLSLSHVDAVIASYNIRNAQDQKDIDVYYLTDMLSQDAVPQMARQIDPEKLDDDTRTYLTFYFENIRGENSESGIRKWNYSRYAAMKASEEWIFGKIYD